MSDTPHENDSVGDGMDAPRSADELVADGLLRHLNSRDTGATEGRLAKAFAAIDQQAAGPKAVSGGKSYRLIPRWAWGAAAMVAIAGTVMFLGLPGERSAMAQVQQTLAAMRSVGDRRYVVHLNGAENGGLPNGIIDTRSPGLLLIQHRPPWQKEFTTVGRDAEGKWALRSDGQIERERPNRYWPPWVTIDGESLFADSLDDLLASLPNAYTLGTPVRESLQGGDRMYTRITATRINATGPQPHVVDMWIDPETRLADRVELRWNRGPMGPGREGDGPGPRHGPDGDDRHDHGPGHEHDHEHDGGPGRPHSHEHDHDFGPHGGQEGPGRGPHEHEDEGFTSMPPLAMMQWMGEEGVMLMWSSKPGGPKGGPHGGGAKGDRGPGLLTFQRIPVPELPADWFKPESHVPAASEQGDGAGTGENN